MKCEKAGCKAEWGEARAYTVAGVGCEVVLCAKHRRAWDRLARASDWGKKVLAARITANVYQGALAGPAANATLAIESEMAYHAALLPGLKTMDAWLATPDPTPAENAGSATEVPAD